MESLFSCLSYRSKLFIKPRNCKSSWTCPHPNNRITCPRYSSYPIFDHQKTFCDPQRKTCSILFRNHHIACTYLYIHFGSSDKTIRAFCIPQWNSLYMYHLFEYCSYYWNNWLHVYWNLQNHQPMVKISKR